MGKDGFMTPKAIATRIKAKGLQRLRWYCQLCEKQCRDENGFKCHQTSDAHRRNMDIFGQSAGKVVYEYSRDFEKAFMDHLKRAHPFTRVLAKNVYNEYINDKHHIHMNSTRWVTLTEFVKYLGKEGKCKVDETEKGWWITLIMKDPMQEIEDEKKLKRTVAEKEEQDRHLTEVNAQVARARKAARLHEEQDTGPSGGDILIKTDDAPLVLSLAPSLPGADEDLTTGAGGSAGPSGPRTMGLPPRAPGGLRGAAVARPKAAFGDDEDEEDNGAGPSKASGAGPSKGGSKLDEMMKKEKEAKARHQAELASSSVADRPGGGPWLAEGIVVKVMSKELERHGYYKKKGVVDKVIDKYVGEIAMLASGDVVRVDQAQLETVIPQPGGQVLMVAGPHKGFRATLKEIDTDRFRALVKLGQGPRKGDEIWADYEAMSKLAS